MDLGVAAVHGFGKINSSRDTGFGFATAGYNARIDGVISELSYISTRTRAASCPKRPRICPRPDRIVPGMGGLDPVCDQCHRRPQRVLVGAEVGHYWIFGQKILDLSAYGKFVDNLVQNFTTPP